MDWNADSRIGQPFERVITFDPSTSKDEIASIINTIHNEGLMEVKSNSNEPTILRVSQPDPTHQSQHIALLSLWRLRRSGAIKYLDEENESS